MTRPMLTPREQTWHAPCMPSRFHLVELAQPLVRQAGPVPSLVLFIGVLGPCFGAVALPPEEAGLVVHLRSVHRYHLGRS